MISSSVGTTSSRADVEYNRVQRARRGLIIYLAFILAFAIILEGLIIATRNLLPWVPLLMWSPALSSFLARLILREGFKDVSFRFGGRKGLQALVIALLLPTATGLIAYGVAWLTGLARYDLQLKGIAGPSFLQFFVLLIVLSTINTLFSALTAGGEEIGWRGYMLTRLIDAGIPRPVLVSGLIWGLWHLPLIFAGLYVDGPSPVLSAVVFMVSVTAIGYIIARLRLETGSIWPAIVLHAAWNSIIQGGFDRATKGSAALLWTGESGILVALTLVLLAIVFSRGQWKMIRALPRRGEPALEEEVHHP